MKPRRGLIAFGVLGAALILTGYAFREPLAAWGRSVYTSAIAPRMPGATPEAAPAVATLLAASGTIETHTVSVSSPRGGRLAALRVSEGDLAAPGSVIAEMDTTLDDAELAQARTGVALAEAQLALLEAGAPKADLDVLRAVVAQAEATAAAAHTAAQDAEALVSAPDTLDVEIAGAQYAVQVAEAQLDAAKADATAADLEEQLWGRTVKLLEQGFDFGIPGLGSKHFKAPADKMEEARLQWNLSSQKQWQAHAQVNIASSAVQSARQGLSDLRAQKADPQALRAQANAAAAAAKVADAAVSTAEANLNVALAGPTQEQIERAKSLVTQAQAGVEAVQARRGQAIVPAPDRSDQGNPATPWTVSTVVLHDGEVASPGSPIVRLADLGQVKLTVYVSEPDLGRVSLGQKAQVTVDSYPGRSFLGAVTQIANEAQFTPKNVETRQQRANTVYAVTVTLDNAGGALKPGMPADAVFCGDAGIGCTGQAAASPSAGIALPQLNLPANPTPAAIQASGMIEGDETTVNAELGGRVVEVAAQEGDTVTAGQVLVRLDPTELEAQYQQAQAAQAAARAALAEVTAAPQPSKIAQAQAQVAQAEATVAAARSARADALQQRNHPQDLDAQINNARGQLDSAIAQVDLAKANLKAAQTLQESVPAGTGSDEDKTLRATYDQQVLAAQAALRAAEAQQQGAQATLGQLQSIRARPVALDAAVHGAEGQVAQDEAALAVAQAALAQVEARPQTEAVAVAQARVDQADAAARLAAATLEKLALESPVSGTVTAQTIHAGEVAQPSAPLLTLVDLQHVKLVIYVSEGRIGQVRVGQPAEVTTDSYPGRRFTGTVTHIGDEAEFTPKNVQTQEERVKMVFRVEVALDNPDGALKPGMPADAMLID
jgi:HlyD family secretion protein